MRAEGGSRYLALHLIAAMTLLCAPCRVTEAQNATPSGASIEQTTTFLNDFVPRAVTRQIKLRAVGRVGFMMMFANLPPSDKRILNNCQLHYRTLHVSGYAPANDDTVQSKFAVAEVLVPLTNVIMSSIELERDDLLSSLEQNNWRRDALEAVGDSMVYRIRLRTRSGGQSIRVVRDAFADTLKQKSPQLQEVWDVHNEYLTFFDSAYARRAINALRRAAELCGAKPDPF